MKVVLIGATGNVGPSILDELLNRGHAVTAMARSPEKIGPRDGLTVVKGDAYESGDVAAVAAGHDAVISAFNPGWGNPDIRALFVAGTMSILDGIRQSGVTRVIVVGGAGSLEIAPGVQLVDTPEFPAEWKEGALGARDALTRIRQDTTLDWTFVSPAILLEPGERTGAYRLGTDQPVFDSEGQSRISIPDLAVAIVDELEQPKHIRKRFTSAY